MASIADPRLQPQQDSLERMRFNNGGGGQVAGKETFDDETTEEAPPRAAVLDQRSPLIRAGATRKWLITSCFRRQYVPRGQYSREKLPIAHIAAMG